MAPAHLLDRAAQQRHRVRAGQPGLRAEGELKLARTVLDFEGAQRQAERLHVLAQQLGDRFHLVVALFGEQLIAVREQLDIRRRAGLAGVRAAHVLRGELEDVKLDLQPGDEAETLRSERVERAGELVAGAEGGDAAIRKIRVAQNPARGG